VQSEYEAYLNRLARENSILDAQRRAGIEEAWSQEQQLARAGEKTTRQWTPSELQELIDTGRVSGYEGHHINSVMEYPELAANPDNVIFVTRPEHFNRHGDNWTNPTGPLPLVNRTPWTNQ
jgi:hypothetical protein